MTFKKSMTTIGVVIVSLAILIATTYAWYTTNQDLLNQFSTGDDPNPNALGVTLIEDFNAAAASMFVPGVTVDKEVSAIMTGNKQAIVRVRLEEILQMYKANAAGTDLQEYIATTSTALTSSSAATAVTPNYTLGANDEKWVRTPMDYDSFLAEATGKGLTLVNTSGLGTTFDNLTVYGKVDMVTDGNNNYFTHEFIAIYKDTTVTPNTYQKVNIIVDTLDAQATSVTFTPLTYLQAVIAEPSKNISFEYSWVIQLKEQTGVYGTTTPAYAMTDNTGATLHGMIQMVMGTVYPISDFGTRGQGDWWYQDADGWFYYGQIFEGSGSTTSLVLDTVTLSTAAGNNWGSFTYDINVRLQATQPVLAAFTAEWNQTLTAAQVTALTGTNPANLGINPMTTAAVTMMTAICA